jgi:hypothetical protein
LRSGHLPCANYSKACGHRQKEFKTITIRPIIYFLPGLNRWRVAPILVSSIAFFLKPVNIDMEAYCGQSTKGHQE